MRKQTLFLLFFIICFSAFSQDTLIVDDSPVGLGISIQDFQSQVKKRNVFNALISPPTVIKTEKNKKGELYIKLYINTDVIRVVATKISSKNKKLYKAYEKVQFFYGDQLGTGSFADEENMVEVPNEKGKKPYVIIPNQSPTGRGLYEYTITEVSSGKVVSKLIIEYAFPKPEPEMLTIDKNIIRQNEDRPGDNIYYDTSSVWKYSKEEIVLKNLVKTGFDPETNLPHQLVLPQDLNSIFIRFKRLKGWGESDNFLEYKFSKDSLWKTTVKKDNPFIILRDLPVCKYKLQVRYPHQTDEVLEYEFEIKPVWTQTTSFKVFIGSLTTAFFCFILFLIHSKTQKEKLKKEEEKRKQLQNQITSLQSQLDPHFIFNALNSIQGLINKNHIEDANLYISKFGSLLHEILEKSDKTMHPLTIEIRQLEYYLQLEQLRFRFQYKITIDNNINPFEIDIPVMLLQPYVENAIKHGIIDIREAGVIEINFYQRKADLIIEVHDNGKGYQSNNKPGHGNKLVEERVKALNKFLKGPQIIVEVTSETDKGTCVTFTLYNWL